MLEKKKYALVQFFYSSFYILIYGYGISFLSYYFGSSIYTFFVTYFKFNLIYGSFFFSQIALWIPVFIYYFYPNPLKNRRSSTISNIEQRIENKSLGLLLLYAIGNHTLLSSFLGFSLIWGNFNESWTEFILSTSNTPISFIFLIFCKLIFITDFLFFIFHFSFHTFSFLYFYHKKHHEIIFPSALSTFYVHPIEHAIVNVFPILIGLFFVQPHPLIVWMWLFIATFSAVHSHSGQNYKYFPNPIFHDLHHQFFTINYGITGFWDLIYLYYFKKNID